MVLLSFPVPSMVEGLEVDNQQSSHQLQASWQAGPGVADGYSLRLLDDRGTVLSSISQPSNSTQHLFDQLTPGKTYRVQIQTLSGGIPSKDTTAKTQTRKAVSALGLINNAWLSPLNPINPRAPERLTSVYLLT